MTEPAPGLAAFARVLEARAGAFAVNVRSGPLDGAVIPLFSAGDGARVGYLAVEADGATLFVRALVIEPARRGYGLGSEAAALMRAAAAEAGFAILRAWAPPDFGLAVYFWIRMGLSPRHGPGPDGGIWMQRQLRGWQAEALTDRQHARYAGDRRPRR